jgi:hypothetical protein
MSSTVAKQGTGIDELYFTLEFLFNSGKTEPSTIAGLPRSQIYRFGTEELMGWMEDVTEEEAVEIIDDLLSQIEYGDDDEATYVFSSGESFSLFITSAE